MVSTLPVVADESIKSTSPSALKPTTIGTSVVAGTNTTSTSSSAQRKPKIPPKRQGMTSTGRRGQVPTKRLKYKRKVTVDELADSLCAKSSATSSREFSVPQSTRRAQAQNSQAKTELQSLKKAIQTGRYDHHRRK